MIREHALGTTNKRDHGFQWRGKDISRVEGLSDAVFAFAVTLLVVSLEVPKTYHELAVTMQGLVAFGICFAMLLTIWHTQYLFFRRYSLDDGLTFTLNAVLLFVVAYYVYPLKFLFTTLVTLMTGHANAVVVDGHAEKIIEDGQWPQLLMIYGAGFATIYLIFALLYLRAYTQRAALGLNPVEVLLTRASIAEHLTMMTVGLLSVALAVVGQPFIGGMSYWLIGPVMWWLGSRTGKQRERLEKADAVVAVAT